MRTEKGFNLFGFFDGMPYGITTDRYEDLAGVKNSIRKEKVIKHIESLDVAVASVMSTDMFTGEEFNAAIYDDGAFRFPIDFARYYKAGKIGLPHEYEKYLTEIL